MLGWTQELLRVSLIPHRIFALFKEGKGVCIGCMESICLEKGFIGVQQYDRLLKNTGNLHIECFAWEVFIKLIFIIMILLIGGTGYA